MSEHDKPEERFQAWAAQQALGPKPRKYDRPSPRNRRISDAIVVVLAALFWIFVLVGMVRYVGAATAQPVGQLAVYNPFV